MLETSRVGCDPEFIVVHQDTKLPVSVLDLIGGNKRNPLPVERGALQEDNVLAEINIHPASSKDEWCTNLATVINQLEQRLPPGLAISAHASAIYPETELVHPAALEAGCDPDFNAWTGGNKNRKPKFKGKLAALRSAGGHIHIQLEPSTSILEKMRFVQVFDSVFSMQAVILDKDTQRKQLYGKAGAFRPKPYGVECRTPSNFWVFGHQEWAYDTVQECRRLFTDPEFKVTPDVVSIINKNDQEGARTYLEWLNKTHNVRLHPSLMNNS